MAVSTTRSLGVETVISRLGLKAVGSFEKELRQTLRQIEAALPAFNLDQSIAHVAAEIAALEENLDADRRLALIMLVAASFVALNEGSTRLAVSGPLANESLARIVGGLCGGDRDDDAARAAQMIRAIADLLESGAASIVVARSADDYRPLLYLPPFVYHQRIRAAEERLAERLRSLMTGDGAMAPPNTIDAALADVSRRSHLVGGRRIELSTEQQGAVRAAVTHRLAVVSGGPGTGKTSIVLAILRTLVRLGVRPEDFALAAPTGKAAQRLGESIRDGIAAVSDPAAADVKLAQGRIDAVTIHRLLAYSPERGIFLRHRNDPLAAAVVIVDESSMLDLTLMDRLAGALRPDARLVLLGDAEQLPSVASGAVFRDLVAGLAGSGAEPYRGTCARLVRSYRMNQDEVAGRTIFTLAQRVNQGAPLEAGEAPVIVRASAAALRFTAVELLDPAVTSSDDFLDRWYDARLRDGEMDELVARVYRLGEDGFEHEARAALQRIHGHRTASRILCATRVLATGADRINAAMHLRAAAAAAGRPGRTRWLAGEPVMIVRNDYERRLFNGDQGIIARVRRPDGAEAPMAVFIRGDQVSAFPPAVFGDALEHSYASTIHKAQGSEFDCVAVVMPERKLPLLSRELLYTAVSRARQSVVLVSSMDTLQFAVARPSVRCSGLAELIGATATGGDARPD